MTITRLLRVQLPALTGKYQVVRRHLCSYGDDDHSDDDMEPEGGDPVMVQTLLKLPGAKAMSAGTIAGHLLLFLGNTDTRCVTSLLELPNAVHMSIEAICRLLKVAESSPELKHAVDSQLVRCVQPISAS